MKKNNRQQTERNFWEKQATKYDKRMKSFSLEYQRTVERVIEYIHEDSVVLDVACGTGIVSLEIAQYVDKIEAIDISPSMIEVAQQKAKQHKIENISFNVADAYRLKYPNKYFDIVLLVNILHVIKNPEIVLKEAKRLLKDDGILLISVECSGENPMNLFLLVQKIVKILGIIKYLHFYKYSDINSLLQKNKFKIVKTEHVADMSNNYFVVASL